MRIGPKAKTIIARETRLNNQELDGFLNLGVECFFPKKTIFTSPGTTVDRAFFIKSGCVRHFVKDEQNVEFTKGLMQGDRFMVPSITSLFLQQPSQIYCDALTDVDAIYWPYRDLMTFSNQHPKMYQFLLRSVSAAFQLKERKEIQVNKLTARARYEGFLEEYPRMVNEIPNHYIASFLQIRPETLSRIRSELAS